MSKNKYRLPCNGKWYVEYGGIKKEDSHSWDIISQRYAYDIEIRKNNLPYHDDYTKEENYYSYLEDIICPCDGWVIYKEDKYENTRILKNRPIINDIKDPCGNHIIIKHPNNEYSFICHIEKGTITVNEGDVVKEGDILGKVGNSGNTQGPHIHFHIQNTPDILNGKGIKITMKNTVDQNNKKIKYLVNGMTVENKE